MICRKWTRSISNSVLGFRRPQPHHAAPARKHVHFAVEFSATQHAQARFARRRNREQFQAAAQDHEDAVMRVSLFHHNFAGLRLQFAPKRSQPRNLRVVQLREHEISGIRSVGHNEPRAAAFILSGSLAAQTFHLRVTRV